MIYYLFFNTILFHVVYRESADTFSHLYQAVLNDAAKIVFFPYVVVLNDFK